MIKRLVVVVGVLAIVVVVVSLIAGWLLARPMQARVGSPPPALDAEVVRFPSQSGSTVTGWWCPVRSAGKGAVVLLPGVRANRLSMVDRAVFLHRAKYSVLLIDFQATGESPGKEITFGWLESRDVLAAVDFVRSREPGGRVAIIGSSLGGAAALLATPPLRVDAIVLEGVYPTIERATTNRLRNYLGAVGPFASPLLLSQLSIRVGVSANKLRPLDHIASVNCPVFIINGLDDRRTTREDALLLYSRAHSPKELWLIPHAGHVDLHGARQAEYEMRVSAFLQSAIR